jgi:NADH-quinone oxidoreductase subunit E
MLSEVARNRILEEKGRYPDRRSAVMPALYVVQQEEGHLSLEGMSEVARLLDIPHSDVIGVATFYSMYFESPKGRYVLDVCKTISCALLGAESLVDYLSRKLGIKVGETTQDGLFTLRTVECLGACGGSPVMMVGDTYYENLTAEKLDEIIEDLRTTATEVTG